jgi:hypothetical protein
MADLVKIMNSLLATADAVNDYLPAAGMSQLGIDLGKKLIGMIDDVKPHIPLDQQGQAQARRAALAAKVATKVADEARKLRGNN